MEKTTFFDYKPKILNDDLTENLEDYVYKRTSVSDSEFQEEPREGDAENSKILLDLDKELEKNISTAKNVLFGDVYVRNYSVDDDDERVDDTFNSYFESRNVPDIKIVDVDSNDQFILGHSGNVKFDDLLIDIDNCSQNDNDQGKFDKIDYFQDQDTCTEKYSDILFPGHSTIYKEDTNDNTGTGGSTLLDKDRNDLEFIEQPEPDFAGFFGREQKSSETIDAEFSNNDFFSNSPDIQSKYSEEKLDSSSLYDSNPFRINSTETAKENEALDISRSLENLTEHLVDEKTLFKETTDNFEQIQDITQYFSDSNTIAAAAAAAATTTITTTTTTTTNNNANTNTNTNTNTSSYSPYSNYNNNNASTNLDNISTIPDITKPRVNYSRENNEQKDNLLIKETITTENSRNADVFDDLLERTRNSMKLIEHPTVYGNDSSTTPTTSVGELLFPPMSSNNSDISINNVNDKFTTEIIFSMSAPSDEMLGNKSQLLTGDTKEIDLFDSSSEYINKITPIEDKEIVIRTSEFQNGRKQNLQRSLRSAMLHNNKIDDGLDDMEKNINNESIDRKLSLDLKANTDQIQKGISALFNIKDDKTPSPTSPIARESPSFPSSNPFESSRNDNSEYFDTSSSVQFYEQDSHIKKDEDGEEQDEADNFDSVKSVEIAPPLPLSEPPDRKTAPTEEIRDHIADFEMDPVTGLRRIDLQDDPVAKAQLFVEGTLSPSYKIRKRSGDKPSDENIEFQKQRESIMDEMRVRKKIFNTEFLKEDIEEDEVFDDKVKESERKYWQKKKEDEGKKKNSLPNIFRSINSSTGDIDSSSLATTTTSSGEFSSNVEQSSIANLNETKKHWEQFASETDNQNNVNKQEMNEEMVDSAIDREIKAANEREMQLKKERDMLINSQDFQEMTEVDRDTHAQSDVVEEDDLADELERSLDINEKSVVREESLIEREIRLAKEREEELRRQRTSLAQTAACSPPSTPVTPTRVKPAPKLSNSTPTPPTLPSTPSSVHTNSPTTSGRYENSTRMIESRLARELREQREKEDELRSLRKQMGLFTEVDGVETTPILPDVPKIETPPPTPEVVNSPSAPIVENTPPPDSPPPSRIKVAPLLEEDKTDLSQFATVSSETPIEREIRLARDREESFRREKGIKPKAYQEEQIMSVPQQKPTIEDSPNNLNKANQSQSYKKWAHTRIQNEIKLEQAREENLRHQGRIISTSKDYEPDRKKYQEVAPVEDSPSFKKTNGSLNKISNDIQPKKKKVPTATLR